MRHIVLGQDTPVTDRDNPPGFAGFSCPSENGVLYGSVYYAEGLGNPTAVLCHGFPGVEKNYDLAQILRQAGFNTVVFSYRGSWGSRGDFSFANTSVDVRNMVHHILRGKMPCPERFDPEKRIALIGYSMGAFAALRGASLMPEVRDLALLAVWNIGREAELSRTDEAARKRIDDLLGGAGCLYGTSRASLWNEILWKPEEFDLHHDALSCSDKRILMIGADEDLSVSLGEGHSPLKEILVRTGAAVTEHILPGDHAFSAQRWSLARLILNWLSECGY